MKVIPQNKRATQTSGRIKRNSEMPDDLIATNSKLSPRLPNVMMDEMRMAMGIASVSMEALTYHKNFPMVTKSSPLPTRSSRYFQSPCIISTKNAMKNVMINGPIKDLRISLSNFFIMQHRKCNEN